MKVFKAIDLFSGCGGLSCGLIQAGFEVVSAVEIDKDAAQIYSNYRPLQATKVLISDIRKIKGKDLKRISNILEDEIYLLAGCPPCQNFSLQNPDNAEKTVEEKKELLFQFLRIIKEIYPPLILMENVPGIVTSSNGEILQEFLDKLENKRCTHKDKKYFVVNGVLTAADYGVPQARKRFVLQAIRCDFYSKLLEKGMEFLLPIATHSNISIPGRKKWITVKEAIMDLPPIAQGEEYSGTQNIKNHKCASLSEINIKRIQSVRKGTGSRNSLPENLRLKCHKDYSGRSDVYGIMDLNKPAPTITGGCLCYSKGRFGHPTQDRAISIREAARLQTFPDDFEFSNSLTRSGLQIGNAVPVKLVKASGQVIHNVMEACIDN